MIKAIQKYIDEHYLNLIGVCKNLPVSSPFFTIDKEIMRNILSFVGPHNLWITDDKYRKLARLEEQDSSVPTIDEEV